jgi:PAS domain S-box-containing protein
VNTSMANEMTLQDEFHYHIQKNKATVKFITEKCAMGFILYHPTLGFDAHYLHPNLSDIKAELTLEKCEEYCTINIQNRQTNCGMCRVNCLQLQGDNNSLITLIGWELLSDVSFRNYAISFGNSPIGTAVISKNLEWLYFNKSFLGLLNYNERELMDTNLMQLTLNEDVAIDFVEQQELLHGQIDHYTVEKRFIPKNGSPFWVILSVSKLNEHHLLYQLTPITILKKAQDYQLATFQRPQTILDASTHVSIIGTSNNGTITVFNKGSENLLGYTPDEMIGKSTFLKFHDEEELAIRSEELSKELGHAIKGEEILTTIPQFESHETREWTYLHKSGTRVTVQVVVTCIRDEFNEPIGYLMIATDLTSIKKVEKDIQSLLAVTNDQNKRLSNFAHIVSHNLRSHSGNFSLILNLLEIEKDPKTREEILGMLRTASDNLSEAILHLNEVAILNTTLPENNKKINLKNALKNAILNVEMEMMNSKGVCNCEVPEDLEITAIPAYLESILLNLVTNAIKYRSPERILQMNFSVQQNDNETTLLFSDNGLGIDLKRHSSKIFGMYKTFHGNPDARGIGLFITKNQMEAMGGKIEIDSMPNVGTTFKLVFYEKN